MPVAKQRKSDAPSGFAFINIAHPGEISQRSTQRAIRSGAMAAVGRARRRQPTRPVIIELEMPQVEVVDAKAKGGIRLVAPATVCLSRTLSSYPSIPPALPQLGIFAVEPDTRARQLLHFMSGEASYIYRPFRVEWFRMALLDSSSYYLCLANAALFLDQYITHRTSLEYTNSVESTRYYSVCLTEVTRQLNSETRSISEGVITTILGFLCHSSTVGNWDQCEMHMLGLEKIIRLRGGFQGLSESSPLFAYWFDIVNAAVQDTPPRFSSLTKIDDGPTEEPSFDLIHILERLETTDFHLTHLGESMRMMGRLANHINRHAKLPQFWNAGAQCTRLIGPAARCILSIPRLDIPSCFDDNEPPLLLLLQETLRLALLILFATLKKAFSLASDEQRLFLERFSDLTRRTVSFSLFPELKLWAYIVVACTREDRIPEAHISEIQQAMRDLQIQRGEDAVEMVRSIIWIEQLLDGKISDVKQQIDEFSHISGSAG